MYSYQRRSQNRDFLRDSHSRLNIQTSQHSRNSSKKKFLQVCSKKGGQLNRSQTTANLRSSTISLPINFEQGRSVSLHRHDINRSQANLRPNPNFYILNSQHQVRGNSLPSKTIIIREIIQQVPVNFSHLHPQSVRIHPEINYRQSLPIKQTTHKNDIIRIDQLKQAAAPIRIFSNAPINHYQLKREPLQIQNRAPQKFMNEAIQISHGQIFPNSFIACQRQNQKPPCESIQRITVQAQDMLSNKSYVECEVKLEEVGINIEPSALRKSRVQEKAKQNYNSLVVTQEDKQGSFKENLQIKSRDCICQKIRNFTSCSQIKIKQVLKPKKNFVFV